MTFPHLDKLIKEQEKRWSRGRSQESHLLSHIKIDQMKSSAPWSSAMEIFDICGIRSSLHFINLPPFSLALSFGSSCESEACRNSRWASKERGFGFWSGVRCSRFLTVPPRLQNSGVVHYGGSGSVRLLELSLEHVGGFWSAWRSVVCVDHAVHSWKTSFVQYKFPCCPGWLWQLVLVQLAYLCCSPVKHVIFCDYLLLTLFFFFLFLPTSPKTVWFCFVYWRQRKCLVKCCHCWETFDVNLLLKQSYCVALEDFGLIWSDFYYEWMNEWLNG